MPYTRLLFILQRWLISPFDFRTFLLVKRIFPRRFFRSKKHRSSLWNFFLLDLQFSRFLSSRPFENTFEQGYRGYDEQQYTLIWQHSQRKMIFTWERRRHLTGRVRWPIIDIIRWGRSILTIWVVCVSYLYSAYIWSDFFQAVEKLLFHLKLCPTAKVSVHNDAVGRLGSRLPITSYTQRISQNSCVLARYYAMDFRFLIENILCHGGNYERNGNVGSIALEGRSLKRVLRLQCSIRGQLVPFCRLNGARSAWTTESCYRQMHKSDASFPFYSSRYNTQWEITERILCFPFPLLGYVCILKEETLMNWTTPQGRPE